MKSIIQFPDGGFHAKKERECERTKGQNLGSSHISFPKPQETVLKWLMLLLLLCKKWSIRFDGNSMCSKTEYFRTWFSLLSFFPRKRTLDWSLLPQAESLAIPALFSSIKFEGLFVVFHGTRLEACLHDLSIKSQQSRHPNLRKTLRHSEPLAKKFLTWKIRRASVTTIV